MRTYQCDGEDGYCPFGASTSNDCIHFCGLGVDDNYDKEEETNDEES